MRLPSSPEDGASVGYDAWRPGGPGGGPGVGPGLGALGALSALADRAPDSIMDTCYMPNNPAHYGLDMFAGEGDCPPECAGEAVPGVPGSGGGAPGAGAVAGSPEPEAGGGEGGAPGLGPLGPLGPLHTVLSAGGGPPSPASTYGVSLGLAAPLSPQDPTAAGLSLHGCLSTQGPGGGVGGYWPDDMMASFSLPPLDLEPLPGIFPFSPCPAPTFKSEYGPLKESKPVGANVPDVTDVLLQLKHAVVHPGQLSPSSSFYPSSPYNPVPYSSSYSTPYTSSYSAPYAPTALQQPSYSGPSASLSYTVHPQMMSSSASGGYGGSASFCGGAPLHQMHHQMEPGVGSTAPLGGGTPSTLGGGAGASSWPPAPTHNVFPSMSVNVSMNMTMHGYPPNRNVNMNMDNLGLQHQPYSYPQVQWTTAPASAAPASPGYGGGSGLLSPPPYPPVPAATYSFTADFRPPPGAPPPPPPPPASEGPLTSFKPVLGSLKPSIGLGPGPVPPRPLPAPSPTSSEGSSGGGLKRAVHSVHSCSKLMSPSTPDDSGRPNLCRICGKTYARPSTLKTHLRTHSGEKPYRCDDCNKSFSQAANLTAHVRTHSGEKPFRCPICDRRFSQSSSVTTHMRTHSGERPYRCRLCKKAFSDSSTLTKHLRIHSGEKPYQCKLCLLRFSQSGNLNRHMRVHGGSGVGGPGSPGSGPPQLLMMTGA